MNNQDEEKQALLTKLGFNTSEAKIHITLSKIGPSTVKTIAKTAQTDRGETYRVIAKLEEKGFLQRILAYPVKFKAVPITDLLPILIQGRRSEITEIEKEAKQLITHDENTNNQLKREEYITYIPQAGKSFKEIQREVESVKKHILSVASIKTNQTIGQLPWGNLYPPLLEKGVKIIHVINEPCTKKEVIVDPETSRYPNYSLRYIPRRDSSMSRIELVIHDDEKVWIKTGGDNYSKSSWIFSNNPHVVAFARYCFNRIMQASKPIQLKKNKK